MLATLIATAVFAVAARYLHRVGRGRYALWAAAVAVICAVHLLPGMFAFCFAVLAFCLTHAWLVLLSAFAGYIALRLRTGAHERE